jgi:hypothetical protein
MWRMQFLVGRNLEYFSHFSFAGCRVVCLEMVRLVFLECASVPYLELCWILPVINFSEFLWLCEGVLPIPGPFTLKQ